MKRVLHYEEQTLPLLPIEVVELIFEAIPLEDTSYSALCRFRTVYRGARRLMMSHMRRLLMKFVDKLGLAVINGASGRMFLETLPNTRSHSDLLVSLLLQTKKSTDPALLWNLLTRTELATKWQEVGNHYIDVSLLVRLFDLTDREKFYTVSGMSYGAVYYYDEKEAVAKKLKEHDGAAWVTNMSPVVISQFTKTLGANSPHLPILRATATAAREAYYFETVQQLRSDDDKERYLRFHPQITRRYFGSSTPAVLRLTPDSAVYTHLYSNSPAMVAFRRTLFYTNVSSAHATLIYRMNRTIHTLPAL